MGEQNCENGCGAVNDSSCINGCGSIAKCDIFDFMAKYVGMTVIHPGGFAATKILINALKIGPDSRVIDIACGKGTSAIYLAEHYGCNVVAVDIDEQLIEDAKHLTKRKGLQNKIEYHVGDALNLPFDDNVFDAAISQAMLVLVDDKEKAIREARRVIKKGGTAGWLELSWKKEPPKEFLEKVSTVICAYCMGNVSTFEGWKETFSAAGINDVSIIPLDFNVGGNYTGMFRDEGFLKVLSIMFRIMKNKEIRHRMKLLNNFFKEYSDIFACGVYYFDK